MTTTRLPCRRCGGSVERIPRRARDRLVSTVLLVRRVECESCGWVGTRVAHVRPVRLAAVLLVASACAWAALR